MQVSTRECMFCQRRISNDLAEPENLAFLNHLGDSPACMERFQVWTRNMGEDFRGD